MTGAHETPSRPGRTASKRPGVPPSPTFAGQQPRKTAAPDEPGTGRRTRQGAVSGASDAPPQAAPRREPPEPLPTIRDPLHKSIPMEPFALELIDTPQVQRLRRIKQLGGVHFVYPGANHTRFEHVVGAYATARLITQALDLPEAEAQTVQAAALLHDVGHGPFSHTSEVLLKERGRRHEDHSVDLIQWSILSDILARNGLETPRVADAVLGKGTLGALVSGDLDADRMDYLMRDAHYTGVGITIDPDRIAACLRIHGGEVLLHERGLASAEALLVARFLMYPKVYLHHTVRAVDQMLVAGMRVLVEDGLVELKQLQEMDDATVVQAMRDGPRETRRIAQAYELRELPKRVLEGGHSDVVGNATLEQAARDPAARLAAERAITEEAGLERGQVLLDIPQSPIMKEVGIRILGRDGSVRTFHEASTLVANLERAQLDHWHFWVFAPASQAETVLRATRRVLGWGGAA